MKRSAFLLLICLSLGAGCGPINWSTVGTDVLKCHAPGIQAAIQTGLEVLIGLASGGSPDYAAMGKGLALQYGPSTALCIVEKGAATFGIGGNVLPGGQASPAPPNVPQALRWLTKNRADWIE